MAEFPRPSRQRHLSVTRFPGTGLTRHCVGRPVADGASELHAAVEILHAAPGAPDGQEPLVALDVGIELHADARTTVVSPRGDVDRHTSPRLAQLCLAQVDGTPLGRMLLDLAGVTHLDSSGLAVLVEVQRVCAANHTQFALTGLTTKSPGLGQIAGLDAVFDIA